MPFAHVWNFTALEDIYFLRSLMMGGFVEAWPGGPKGAIAYARQEW